ncbi:ribonuclease H-like domain-containing protein [Tanacetum coccineum]
MDTCASSHLNDSIYSLSDVLNMRIYPFVSAGDDYSILVTKSGHNILPTPHRPLHLNNVLITPNIFKNLFFIRQFVRDNNCIVEFGVFGFSVKDFMTRRVLLRCDSIEDLYPVTISTISHTFLTSQYTWHQCLGHPKSEVLCRLLSSNSISYSKEKTPVLCHTCQLGKHVRLPFVSSNTSVKSCFETLVPRLTDANIVRCMWLFRHKYLADGTLSYYKAHLVVNGSTQLEVHQLDVKNAFLHGDLSKIVYMHQPLWFQDSAHANYRKYAAKILERAHMVNYNPNRTHVDTESKLGDDDVDWAGCPTTQRSTLGYCVFLGNNLLSRSSKHQPMLSRSIAEAEYRSVASVVAETCWLRNLLFQHQRTNHIEIDIHFVQDLVVVGRCWSGSSSSCSIL